MLSATWPGRDAWFDALFALRLDVLEHCGARAYLMDGTLRALPAAWLQQRGEMALQIAAVVHAGERIGDGALE